MQLPPCYLQQLVGRQVDTLVEPQLLLEPRAAETKRSAAPRGHRVPQVRDVRAQGVGGLDRRVREHAEQVQVLQVAECARQVALDEGQQSLERLDADLDEQPRRLGDVLPRRVEQPRHLPQLRTHAPRPLCQVGVGEEGLPGEALRQYVGVVERIALPAAHLLEGEQMTANPVAEHPPLHRLDRCQCGGVDAVESARPAAELADAGVDGRPAQVLEQVVVGMDAVSRRSRRVHLVDIGKVLLDEVRERFGDLAGDRLAHRTCHEGWNVTLTP